MKGEILGRGRRAKRLGEGKGSKLKEVVKCAASLQQLYKILVEQDPVKKTS